LLTIKSRNKIKNEKNKTTDINYFFTNMLAFNASNAQDIKSSTAAFGFKGGPFQIFTLIT
jgi:hypothetical protein